MRYLSRRRGLRRFDPVAVGQHETNAWVSYYRHEWLTFLRASVGMVASGFHMSRRDTLAGCIGGGCLSLKTCALSNPGDVLAEQGPGAVRL